MSVQHESRGVEALHGTDVAGFGIYRIFAPRCERSRSGHRDRELPILAVVDKTSEWAIISIRIIAPTRVTIKMPERPVKRSIGDVSTTLLGQQ